MESIRIVCKWRGGRDSNLGDEISPFSSLTYLMLSLLSKNFPLHHLGAVD